MRRGLIFQPPFFVHNQNLKFEMRSDKLAVDEKRISFA